MKILSASQIRELDKFTIEHEPVASIDLMERAARRFVEAITPYMHLNSRIWVLCGMGNNGGDGLAIARILMEQGFAHVSAFVVKHSPKGSDDFQKNENRLKNLGAVHYIETELQFPKIAAEDFVIDAIFGTGLNRAVDGISEIVISAINHTGAKVFSVDIPSGMFCDALNAATDSVVKADRVFTFYAPKFSFLQPHSTPYLKNFEVLDIGLNKAFAESLQSSNYYLSADDIKARFKPRLKFGHKGTYGHALLCAGSYGKMGAAELTVKAALHSGAGLVSALVPGCGHSIMQMANPEAMVVSNGKNKPTENQLTASSLPQPLADFNAIGAGPGLGAGKDTNGFLHELFKTAKGPFVLDADALNVLAADKKLFAKLPAGSIITPHPGEFRRLVGVWKDDLHKLELQLELARTKNIVVVLKGAHTSIAGPDGLLYFNSTGNPGMAKGGSGDVLTGIITALLAQQYAPIDAAIIGVYVHGLAGDFAASRMGQTFISAQQIIYYLSEAFKTVEHQ